MVRITRREFIAGLAGAWPSCGSAQQRLPVVGYISPGRASEPNYTAPFREGLHTMGLVEGANVMIDIAWAEGQNDRLPAIAAEFARRGVDVIIVTTTAALLAASAATKTIPIVFMTGSDPVASRLVASLNRPGGNLTGVYNLQFAVIAKRLELLREVVPAATLAAYLGNPTNRGPAEAEARELQTAARILGLRSLIANASTPSDLESAFATLLRERADALVVGSDAFFWNHTNQVVALANRERIPAIYARRAFTEAGGLMSYGTDFPGVMREVGIYAGRILKGERPSDLPVQQATKVELALNAKTEKALGLTFPLTLLGRADEVIE